MSLYGPPTDGDHSSTPRACPKVVLRPLVGIVGVAPSSLPQRNSPDAMAEASASNFLTTDEGMNVLADAFKTEGTVETEIEDADLGDAARGPVFDEAAEKEGEAESKTPEGRQQNKSSRNCRTK